MRVDAAERDRDVGIVDRELRDLIVGRVRTAGQVLFHRKDDAADLARTVVLGLRRPVARGGACLEVRVGGFIGLGKHTLMFQMDMNVERHELADIDAGSAHAMTPMMTCAPGLSAYRSSTRCARRASTARWLMDPLSVTS